MIAIARHRPPPYPSSSRLKYCVALLGFILFFHCAATPGADTLNARETLGRTLYREGRSTTGEPLRARVQGGVPISGAQLACMSCHRRSGLGSSEGNNLAPAVTGPVLYTARERRQRDPVTAYSDAYPTRPAYTDASLRRALREGIDANGRALDPLMPRYALDDNQLDALIAYLKSLGAQPAPGVTTGQLHLATLVTPGVDPKRRDTMLQVLRKFFDNKNARTRHEPERSRNAPWHLAWKMQAYREVVLHVWEVEGSRESWPAQLETLYAAQPVFAMVSGIGSGEWQPVHDFCEAREIPCLFPNTDLPASHDGDFYSLYFNQGMALEARVAAHFLIAQDLARGPVLQIVGPGVLEHAAAEALRQALPTPPLELSLPADENPTIDANVQALMEQHPPSAVVIWGSGALAQRLLPLMSVPNAAPPLLLSATLGQPESASRVLQQHPRVYWIHPQATPESPPRGESRALAWLSARGIEVSDRRTALDTYFAAMVTSGAISMLFNRFSREYLIERIEHGTENALSSGAFPHLSLGPNQRVASKGAYVVQVADSPAYRLVPITDWIVP